MSAHERILKRRLIRQLQFFRGSVTIVGGSLASNKMLYSLGHKRKELNHLNGRRTHCARRHSRPYQDCLPIIAQVDCSTSPLARKEQSAWRTVGKSHVRSLFCQARTYAADSYGCSGGHYSEAVFTKSLIADKNVNWTRPLGFLIPSRVSICFCVQTAGAFCPLARYCRAC